MVLVLLLKFKDNIASDRVDYITIWINLSTPSRIMVGIVCTMSGKYWRERESEKEGGFGELKLKGPNCSNFVEILRFRLDGGRFQMKDLVFNFNKNIRSLVLGL